MSRTKVFTPSELRAEAARRRISQREIASALGIAREYVCTIMNGHRDAPTRRQQMQDYILSIPQED